MTQNITKTNHNIICENLQYWSKRAPGYSEVNQAELKDEHNHMWKSVLSRHIDAHFPDRDRSDIHILDIGTGPGFFSIILTELGYRMAAVDLTPSMLEEAKKNAGSLADLIDFRNMNAEALTFADETFDVVVTRNLTWNLPHPEIGYAEWVRVLKKDGLLLNFDANWYYYLFDMNAAKAYEADRSNTADKGYNDQNVGENFDVMEDIARRIPLSSIMRPYWDVDVLSRLGMDVSADRDVWKHIWSAEEKTSFASTPMFLIEAKKAG